jgi:hypothetical protein
VALRPFRQVEDIHEGEFPVLATSERGGILSFASASGLTFLEYARNPSGVIPLGLQLNDVEWLNFEYQPFPYARDVRVPYDIPKVATQGLFETDWLYLVGPIYPGMPAYLGPSGTITNDATLGSYRVGKFMGILIDEPHMVVFSGLGFSRTWQEYQTHNIVTENNPADQVYVSTPGYARVRIDQKTIARSQAGMI